MLEILASLDPIPYLQEFRCLVDQVEGDKIDEKYVAVYKTGTFIFPVGSFQKKSVASWK
jgi:hypothetical protein